MTERALEYRWLLPATLQDAPEGRRPAVRRSTRDWIVDIAVFLLSAGLGLITADEVHGLVGATEPIRAIDQLVGALACVAVWLRRRWPVGLALVLTLVSTVSNMASVPALVALFTVVVHRPFRPMALVVGANLLTLPVYLQLWPDPTMPYAMEALVSVLVLLVVVGWGMFVRARRQLVLSLRDRAERAEVEAEFQVTRARRLERERIAREMHDVLAHRLSLLSVHAGALEYRPDMPPRDVARAAEVIRSGAHQALQDLREVIGVLRLGSGDPEDGGGSATAGEAVSDRPDRPQPTLATLEDLVEESRLAGTEVEFDLRVGDPSGVPAGLGRNAYRIVQEGLTNARKHAADAPVELAVAGGPGEGLTVEVVNPVTGGRSVPGSGTGLIGLTERAELMGGRLEYGPAPDGRFRLGAWLPWPE
ncbi:two-component sensor histidine kinase [Planomonospora parontospora subsp. parontospora]|uniref:histidine kinase n=3 Tax=Planomonospora parontospora TaxID=58119 RepID=A0AA37F267_9ACTN|nr:histidine kinase [Planomonospora parontospora]GGK46686.1 two-component sensor histidine kinase [Planomonospora parontospora]GII06509.1 two-component sensor histidine kinase [Planomonospora parontospora subsp. parontospora]